MLIFTGLISPKCWVLKIKDFGSDLGIEPIEVLPGLKAVSLALLFEDRDQPIIWRGPLKMITIKQFLNQNQCKLA